MDDKQLMKFKITDSKLIMEIKISDLVWLFHNSPSNIGVSGDELYAKIKPGKHKEFVEYIISRLQETLPYDENNTSWGQPFENAFEDILESAEDEFCRYSDNE